MRRNILCLVVICFLSAALIVPAAAQTPYRNFQDRPSDFIPGQSFGYFIWHDNDGWHVRTTTAGREHKFHGIIRIGGEFWALQPVRTERGDRIRHDLNRNTLQFSLETAGGIDGFDFQVRDTGYVQFELYIDGRPAKPREITLGRHNWHPGGNIFRLSWEDNDRDNNYRHNRYEGQPTALGPGLSRGGDFIWHDEDGWHLRTATKMLQRHYMGIIKTDGDFRNVRAVSNEGSDRIQLDRQRDEIRFSFRTGRDVDGLDFWLHNANYLEFHLMLDGRPVETSRIYIGRNNAHPDSNPFRLRL